MLRLTRRQRALASVLFAGGVIAVIVGSLLPASSPVMTAVAALPFTDKAIHFTAYLTLAALAALARPGLRAAASFIVGLALLGAALELAQNLVPGRTPELADEFANVLGSISGIIVGRLAAAKPAPATIES
jgi:hypothetical protein